MISINTLGVLMTMLIATFVTVNADERDDFRRPTFSKSRRKTSDDNRLSFFHYKKKAKTNDVYMTQRHLDITSLNVAYRPGKNVLFLSL